MKLTFATLKNGADTIGKNAHIAHDLFRQGDTDALHVLDQIIEDCAVLGKQARQIRAEKTGVEPMTPSEADRSVRLLMLRALRDVGGLAQMQDCDDPTEMRAALTDILDKVTEVIDKMTPSDNPSDYFKTSQVLADMAADAILQEREQELLAKGGA